MLNFSVLAPECLQVLFDESVAKGSGLQCSRRVRHVLLRVVVAGSPCRRCRVVERRGETRREETRGETGERGEKGKRGIGHRWEERGEKQEEKRDR